MASKKVDIKNEKSTGYCSIQSVNLQYPVLFAPSLSCRIRRFVYAMNGGEVYFAEVSLEAVDAAVSLYCFRTFLLIFTGYFFLRFFTHSSSRRF